MASRVLIKASAICALLAVVSFILEFVIIGAAGGFSEDTGEMLQLMSNNREAAVASQWFFLLVMVLSMPLALGLYQALPQAWVLLRLAVLFWVIGNLLNMVQGVSFLIMASELAPAYAQAGETTKTSLVVIGDLLFAASEVAHTIGNILGFGIAMVLFAIASIRAPLGPKWAVVLAVVAAIVGGWLHPLEVVSPLVRSITLIGVIAGVLWILVMGIVLLRVREPASQG